MHLIMKQHISILLNYISVLCFYINNYTSFIPCWKFRLENRDLINLLEVYGESALCNCSHELDSRKKLL